jgi:hypothetical protein
MEKLSKQEKIEMYEKNLEKFPTLMSLTEVQEALGVAKRIVVKLVESGKLKPRVWEKQKHKKISKVEVINYLISY